jgi:hypothetical protein
MTKLDSAENIAVVFAKLEYIQRDIAMIRSNDMKEIKATLKEVADKQDKQDNRITSLETKVGIIGVISLTFTALASSVAAWLGQK